MNAIYAKTRHVYPSYTDYWRLVEAANYPTCFIDEIDLTKSATYITTPWNGETPTAIRAAVLRAGARRQAKLVWHNLERDLADAGEIGSLIAADIDLFDQVWVSDRSYVNLHPSFKFVALGGHKHFGTTSRAKVYDVCHLAYLWGRREAVVNDLRSRGRSIAPEAFGREAQDREVATSRLMLNMHQYDKAQIVAPIRFAVAASYGLALVSEPVTDPYPLVKGDFVTAPIDHLADRVDALLDNVSRCGDLADRLYANLVLHWPFNYCVDKAVDELWSLR